MHIYIHVCICVGVCGCVSTDLQILVLHNIACIKSLVILYEDVAMNIMHLQNQHWNSIIKVMEHTHHALPCAFLMFYVNHA